jgi:hypothetical protein
MRCPRSFLPWLAGREPGIAPTPFSGQPSLPGMTSLALTIYYSFTPSATGASLDG